MPVKNITTMNKSKFTKKDCEKAISRIVKIFGKSLGDSSFSFMVYGSYINTWRNGMSDIDGIIYFKKTSFLKILSDKNLKKIHLNLRNLYKKIPFSKTPGFLSDIRVLDSIHGSDGRFMIHDSLSFKTLLTPDKVLMIHGNNFTKDLNPVSLFNLDEFNLAMGLQSLRNYLIFELAKTKTEASKGADENALKTLRVLPRIATKMLGESSYSISDGLDTLQRHFPKINYQPLRDINNIVEDYAKLDKYLASWHDTGVESFINCWRCYEETLISLMTTLPMLGKH